MLTGSISWTVARTGTVHILCCIPFSVCSVLLTLGSTPNPFSPRPATPMKSRNGVNALKIKEIYRGLPNREIILSVS
jgi:hypothetical protein